MAVRSFSATRPSIDAPESAAVDHLTWETKPIRVGQAGVNLAKSVDSLEANELAILTNAVPTSGGGVEVRQGQTSFITMASSAARVHSMARLNDPNNNTFTRFWGADQTLQRGATGAAAVVESGFSGNPLTFAAWETEFSGEPWMYIADADQMRKASRTSAVLEIGLPAPDPPTYGLAEELRTAIAAFDDTDGTDAALWSGVGGVDDAGDGASDLPNITDVAGVQGSAVNVQTVVGSAGKGYPTAISLPIALDLTKLQGGTVDAADDDIVYWSMKIDVPTAIAEIRWYFVVGDFTPDVIPGADPAFNLDAYVRVYRPSDYSDFAANAQTALNAGARVRTTQLIDGYAVPRVSTANEPAVQSLVGAGIWTPYGVIGAPVRRGEFLKIGNAGDAGKTWADISGIVIVIQTSSAVEVNITFDDAYLTGGGNPDTSEPDAIGYDYRITHYDLATGAESNMSAAQDPPTLLDSRRQRVVVTPASAFGRATVVQRAYRRGGSLGDDWFGPVGQSETDGGEIVDNTLDITAAATGTGPVNHDQPITTTDDNGDAIYAQPLPILFGPISGYLFGLGDPYRPGDLYWCLRDEPDHWPAVNHESICPAAEILQAGGVYGTQGFCFSTRRLYLVAVNPADGSVSTSPTECSEGLEGRWGMAVGLGGVYFVARDGIRVTQLGTSKLLSDQLRPLFRGLSKNGYHAIDFDHPEELRLGILGDELHFGFRDSTGGASWWIYSLIYEQWRFHSYGRIPCLATSEPGQGSLAATSILGGLTTGAAYYYSGYDDDGVAISWQVRTGADDCDRPREEKLFGDLVVWADLAGSAFRIQPLFNVEKTTGAVGSLTGSVGPERYLFDLFGVVPQHANTISIDLQGSGMASARPTIQQVGVAVASQPEITMNRATTWTPLNSTGEAYLQGCRIDCDTGGTDRTLLVEGLLNGDAAPVATLTINSSGGRRIWRSWTAVHVDMVRLRPIGACDAWMLFGIGWLSAPEPPRLALWDTGLENLGDTYYTGVDIECDTFGHDKTLVCVIDGNIVPSVPSIINANGKRLIHITFQAGRGHIYQFYTTDSNLGLLYSHKWIVQKEPGEQSNWNQNYTVSGTLADKWLKGILLECDTFGQDKTVTVEIDGTVVQTLTVNTNGRKALAIAFAQSLGRVFRIYPTDTNPGRLYSNGWLFDEEPYQLTRYETQELALVDEWALLLPGQITIKSSATVTMQVLGYGQSGTLLSNNSYSIPSTSGVKAMIYLPVQATKGVLYKCILTSAAGFWLYREESWVELQPWSGGAARKLHPFGNDDLDASRSMQNAALAAARTGGTLDEVWPNG